MDREPLYAETPAEKLARWKHRDDTLIDALYRHISRAQPASGALIVCPVCGALLEAETSSIQAHAKWHYAHDTPSIFLT